MSTVCGDAKETLLQPSKSLPGSMALRLKEKLPHSFSAFFYKVVITWAGKHKTQISALSPKLLRSLVFCYKTWPEDYQAKA